MEEEHEPAAGRLGLTKSHPLHPSWLNPGYRAVVNNELGETASKKEHSAVTTFAGKEEAHSGLRLEMLCW